MAVLLTGWSYASMTVQFSRHHTSSPCSKENRPVSSTRHYELAVGSPWSEQNPPGRRAKVSNSARKPQPIALWVKH